ncbi:MAG: hypothetical protein ACOC29_03150, partial [Candidatus Sumerlaeota bacterium]
MHRVLALLLILTLAVACSQNPGFESEDQAQLIRDLRTSFVAVEYTLQKDDGDEPQASGMGSRCPNCGGWHGSSVNTAFNEERPAELEGYLIAPTRVILTDPVIHPRFIKKLEVRFGDQAVAAKPVAWARDQYAYMLELEKPLEGAVPLEFDAEAEGPYFFAMQTLGESEPSASLKPFAPQVVLRYEDDAMMASQDMGLVVNTEGTPVGMIYNPELALDDSWKGSPLEWDLVEKDAMEEIDQRIQAIVENKIVRTELIFRSPSGEEDMYSYHHYGRGESFDGTEANVAGMLWDKETLLVLGDLKPDNTARLEKIRVHTKDGAVIEAKFKASLKDLPVMVATLEEPIDNPLDLYSDDLDALRHKLSVGVLVNVVGESREIRTMPFRLMGFQKGREGRYYPQLARLSTAFLFTDDGKLAIFPGGFRDKPWEERYHGSEDMLMQVSLLAERVKDVEQYADTANIPLSE